MFRVLEDSASAGSPRGDRLPRRPLHRARLGARRVGVVLVGCAALAGLYGGALLYAGRTDRQLFGAVFNRAHTQERVLALTFDDGPREPDTRLLLDALDRAHVRATFFMIGGAIERNPELAREVVRRGHQVGNHSYSHARMLFVSTAFCRDEIARTDALLRTAGAMGPIHFRAPYGQKLWSLPWVLAEMDRLDVLSSIAIRDYDRPGTDRIVSEVLRQMHPGAVVALHDGGGERDQTVAAVEQLIPALRAQGYRFLTIDELRALDRRGQP